MAVEAYALVVTKRGIRWVSLSEDPEVGLEFHRDVEVSFCRVRLVEGRGKVPRWKVVENISVYTPGMIAEWCKTHDIHRYEDLTRVSDIDDRRVTLKQIRQLFPETKDMPFGVACDFVRDRL